MQYIATAAQYEEVKQTKKVVFVFSADWCPDCRFIEPVLPEIEQGFPEYAFYYVDRDQLLDVCQRENVFGIPSFIAYDNGKELGRFVSKDRKTKEEIEQFIRGL
ncbi:thiol-disulfide isomerase/thioredoxin [Anoxybacillus voinovskiensis]|uniref:Thiol-disulfide isomerase/thioredoxin n=1 Tax=Anoxybacteroides voinovskiense TaxID=230470 RepID=A0A840DVI1_9BACL|nr:MULTISPECIES: thioredoxin family protein [Anoxybacillus]MBB4074008.1 thiol-disulfide isomerase/thioredoxin [Anoxybacillus voinovskiensis]MCL6586201.1 thioredoxin family protein [Anoxybacillus sp.]GGJ67968.1 thiol reductase thioredoxin [Anoxybacillus voinovskiensis]